MRNTFVEVEVFDEPLVASPCDIGTVGIVKNVKNQKHDN